MIRAEVICTSPTFGDLIHTLLLACASKLGNEHKLLLGIGIVLEDSFELQMTTGIKIDMGIGIS